VAFCLIGCNLHYLVSIDTYRAAVPLGIGWIAGHPRCVGIMWIQDPPCEEPEWILHIRYLS
jgi:hypothetical protein